MRKHINSPQTRVLLVTILVMCGIFSSQIAPLSAFASTAESRAMPEMTAPADSASYEISPSSGVLGKEYEVLVTRADCLSDSTNTAKQIKDLRLYAPTGSGITVTNISQTECRISAKLSLESSAPLGATDLWLIKKNADPPAAQATVRFNVTSITQGPIPPGLNGKGQVDVMWSVLPDGITNDNFGGKVAHQFFCVEVTIGNDSGFDLQLASVGFTLPFAPAGSVVPNSGYRTVRGSLEAYQKLDARNFVVNGLKILGPILTGFIPFFHVLGRRANFSEAINVISNPLEKGVENFWPDIVPMELDRLADQTFRDDVSVKTIVPNNVQARILTFVPRRLLFPKKNSTFQSWVTKCQENKDKECRPDNPQDVMTVLGQVVIVGRQIDYVNRVRVVNNPLTPSTTDHSISGHVSDACDAGVANVQMKLTAAGFAERKVTTDKDGAYNFPNVPDGRSYTVTATLGDAVFTAKSNNTFTLNDTKSGLDFSTGYIIAGKVKTQDNKPLEEPIKVEITGGGLTQTVSGTASDNGEFLIAVPATGATPNFKVNVPKLTKYDTPATPFDWKCDHRDVTFELKKKSTQSP